MVSPFYGLDFTDLTFEFRQDNFTGKTVEVKDPHFEEASILYNVGALHSLLGALDSRTTSDVSPVGRFNLSAY